MNSLGYICTAGRNRFNHASGQTCWASKWVLSVLLAIILIILEVGTLTAHANTVQGAFATIHYTNRADLVEFNTKLGCTVPRGTCLGSQAMPEASSSLLVSALVEHIQQLLDLDIYRLHFYINLLPGTEDVRKTYSELYGVDVDYIAFYSPRTETVYLAIDHLKLNVLVHEITHAIVDRYFDKTPPVKIHELLAQYVENQL